MGGTTSCFSPAAADLKQSVKRGDGESALRLLACRPHLLSSRGLLCSASAVTPLHVACERKQTRVVASILAFLSTSPLSTVQAALLPYCRRTGVPEPRTVAEGVRVATEMRAGPKGQTPLMYACASDAPELVGLLLAKGADPWVRDSSDGRTALHYATMGGCSPETLSALLQGIHPHVLTREECRYVDARSGCGLTALHYAVYSGRLDTLRQLLYDHHPALDAATTSESYDELCVVEAGSTPLHFAAVRGDLAAALELLRYYGQRSLEDPSLADPREAMDVPGQTAFQVACVVHPGHYALAALLRPGPPLPQALRAGLQVAGPQLHLGPPPLAALAAEALQTKLTAEVRELAARAGPSKPRRPGCSPPGCVPPSSDVPFLRLSSLVLETPNSPRSGPLGGRCPSRNDSGLAGPQLYPPGSPGGRSRRIPGSPGRPAAPGEASSQAAGGGSGTAAAATGGASKHCTDAEDAASAAAAESADAVSSLASTSRGLRPAQGQGQGRGQARRSVSRSCGRSSTSTVFSRPSEFQPVRDSEWYDEADEVYGSGGGGEAVVCEVCFEAAVVVAPAGCGHGVCAGCAERLCAGLAAGGKPLPCPFCRRPVSAYVAWVPRFTER